MRHRKDQPDLFAGVPRIPAPYQRHSETSRASAQEIEPQTATLRRQVLAYIRGRGAEGSTDEELCDHFVRKEGGKDGTYRARRVECVEMGLVRDSGRKRQTRSGREAVVWCGVQCRTREQDGVSSVQDD